MISIPLGVVIAQWVLIAFLGWLVITMYRQMGFSLGLAKNLRGLDGLSIGETAPSFEYESLLSGVKRIFSPGETWKLVMIADPLCSSCEKAMHALSTVLNQHQNIPALIVTVAGNEIISALGSFTDAPCEVGRVEAHVLAQLWKTDRAPYFYAVGPDGNVKGRGVHSSVEGITSLLPRPVQLTTEYRVRAGN
jgi:hypothetical protein